MMLDTPQQPHKVERWVEWPRRCCGRTAIQHPCILP
jgi:hypothetical protein